MGKISFLSWFVSLEKLMRFYVDAMIKINDRAEVSLSALTFLDLKNFCNCNTCCSFKEEVCGYSLNVNSIYWKLLIPILWKQQIDLFISLFEIWWYRFLTRLYEIIYWFYISRNIMNGQGEMYYVNKVIFHSYIINLITRLHFFNADIMSISSNLSTNVEIVALIESISHFISSLATFLNLEDHMRSRLCNCLISFSFSVRDEVFLKDNDLIHRNR